jgi:hypothetical protein
MAIARRRLVRCGAAGLLACAIGAVAAPGCLVSQDGSPYLIDGGDLGPCSGNEARVIQASTCKDVPCCGELAFALCLGTHYSDCSCTLLPGYVVVNSAGASVDANIDLGGDCASEAGGVGEGSVGEGGPGEAGDGGPSDGGAKDAARG